MVGAERRSILVWIRLNLTKTWLKLRSSGMRSKQNFIFSSLLFFRFNEGKFKCHSRPFPFQNFKYGHKWVSHRSPCLFNSAYAKPNDRRKLSKLTNHSLYTRKRHCKQCLQAHYSVFPQSSRGFRATLFDPLFPYHLGALKWDSAENANKSTWLKLRKRASEK